MTGTRTLSPASIWLILILLTAAAVGAGEWLGFGRAVQALIAVIAGIKGLLVVMDYMEARDAPPIWRHLYLGWLAAVTCLILGIACAT